LLLSLTKSGLKIGQDEIFAIDQHDKMVDALFQENEEKLERVKEGLNLDTKWKGTKDNPQKKSMSF